MERSEVIRLQLAIHEATELAAGAVRRNELTECLKGFVVLVVGPLLDAAGSLRNAFSLALQVQVAEVHDGNVLRIFWRRGSGGLP